ncbi:transcription elongation factor GreA [Mesorhizobium sp. M7A.F.Ca.CA.001.09.2.1]|uniref:Transcription elongation factor GreA/GreB domain-containing protein n=4 Tax=Mesorhizobium TaxID=68287 RepID=E8TNM6_MESCW|nr:MULTISPECIES: transcription elongation factor GreA [Mesorhizobium]RUY41856.1 transcription elongation factor GreA [Mesorhizobium sp. M7A.F.Ca.CA.001.13.2.1]RUZ91377.1 transcription elongation factor GreA [Mesorhizobium sp. M7A.F.Ca.US.003.02.2.1]RVA46071.1 transcription elongation factor GreA [Mesorhizobium sp. M7A.F.Ca.US.001.01.1.1]ADV14021.1 transcription elongation factor GreA/GreB domain-containing protein [Mesorhizobium ciceri biovar biserrulae WSM1271]AMX92067.1 transcription elongat
MSRAFTREEDSENAIAGVGERPVSQHRNLVTERGLAQIEENLADLRDILAKAERKADRERIAVVSRDLRYWTARRESAELSVPEPGSDVVRFGMGVTIESDDGKKVHWKIVGEDEADPTKGSISHVSPMAVALFGKKIGDLASVNGKEWEIVKLSES